MKEKLHALMIAAVELQARGAIRPEHLPAFQSFRVALEQAHAEAAEPTPLPEPVEALNGLAALIDLQGDKIDAIAQHLGITEGA
jgi:ABC-type sulfate/molybdate transport systems ATPase subunit